MEEKSCNENLSKPVILFLTRAFNVDLIAGLADKLTDNGEIDDFFIGGTYNGEEFRSEFLSALTEIDRENIDKSSIANFWISFKKKFETQSQNKINENFDGKLRQLKLKQENQEQVIETNIFFFHHWFDHQVSPKSEAVVFRFIKSILNQIRLALNIEENQSIKDLRIIMHFGDFIYHLNEEGKMERLIANDFIERLNDYAEKIEIYSFHHDSGYPIWDKVLNNRELYIELCKDDNIDKAEEYILKQFDPQMINERFENFLK